MRPLEVTWIADSEIEPPGPKMVVCVEPYLGFYFRINSHDNWRPCVPIAKEPDHNKFLQWDSFIECTILDLDDYVIQQALKKNGVIGRVSIALRDQLLQNLGTGSRHDRNAIRVVLEGLK
jgi:hypothetical protein